MNVAEYKSLLKKVTVSKLEEEFLNTLIELNLKDSFKTEYLFHPTRKWRFDFANPTNKIAVEIDGGAWVGGRHNTGSGFIADMEKLNAATCLGWKVLRYHSTKSMENFVTDYEQLLEL